MIPIDSPALADLAIVGAGAAGLATAIFTARRCPTARILLLDGAQKPGAKILVSGGGRCNVTNVVVTPDDFCGGSRNVIRRILAAFPAARAADFFCDLGVALHEEEHGKLFPDSNHARTVLDALLAELARLRVPLRAAHRVNGIARTAHGFSLATSAGDLAARRLVLATGGLSLPKTGSDGHGYKLAQSLGHTIVPTTPALAPLLLAGDFHAPLSGISFDVELELRTAGQRPRRLRGALLWTHFGASGPVVLDASRHWHAARLAGRDLTLTVNFLPGDDFPAAEQRFLDLAAAQPRLALRSALARLLPARLADALLARLTLPAHTPLAHLSRETRRRLVHALLAWPLDVRDSRGYAHAEVTAGGVPLDEIDPATMASRRCPGLWLVGEILDVDGRIGGFNFQWSWSSAWVAADGLARDLNAAARTPDHSSPAPPGAAETSS